MLKYIKKGFGLTVGYILASALVKTTAECVLKSLYNDKDYMEKLKERDPKEYEKLKKRFE